MTKRNKKLEDVTPRFAKMIEQFERVSAALRRKARSMEERDSVSETIDRWCEKAFDADMDDLWNEIKRNLTAKGMSNEEADRFIKEVRADAKKLDGKTGKEQ